MERLGGNMKKLEKIISKHVTEKLYREGKITTLEYKIRLAALERMK